MNKELAKTLTTALVQFIDEQRPEGTMCCSNAECKSIEQMLEGEQFDIVEAFIQKKLSRLTEFEKGVEKAFLCVGLENVPNDTVKRVASELLYIAKKELCNGCNANLEGYIKGQQDAKRQHNESVAYHFPTMPQRPLCYEPGGTCTNPHMDCINCPKKTTGGGFYTSSGTSTATLHGNTSATDGKEHNPSFTD